LLTGENNNHVCYTPRASPAATILDRAAEGVLKTHPITTGKLLTACRDPGRELVGDELLERCRDEVGGIRLTGEGPMLSEPVPQARIGVASQRSPGRAG
jgi:hypothetical protein